MSQPRRAVRRTASALNSRIRVAEIAEARTTHERVTVAPRATIEACLDALSWPWSAKLSLLLDQAVIAEESAGDRAWNS